jgi:hypothetical protein
MAKKRGLIAFILALVLNTFNAHALFSGGIFPSKVTQILTYIFITLPKNYNLPPFIIYAKILMWILVFALLDMAAKRIPNMPKKTGNIVALILSLMSVLLMPESVIAYIFKNYSLVISLLLLLVPVILGIVINLGPLKGEGAEKAVLRAFLWIIIGVLTIGVANVIHAYPI